MRPGLKIMFFVQCGLGDLSVELCQLPKLGDLGVSPLGEGCKSWNIQHVQKLTLEGFGFITGASQGRSCGRKPILFRRSRSLIPSEQRGHFWFETSGWSYH